MQDDTELLQRYRDGEEDAFTILIEKYLSSVYGFIFRLVGDSEVSEDIAQETFLKVWKKSDSFNPNQSFKTWLFAIARNGTVDYLRKKKGIPLSAFDTPDGGNVLSETTPTLEPLPSELFEKKENAILVEKALDQLSPGAKELLLLHFKEELTLKEMAEVVGKPINTVKSQHRRALIALRKVLEKDASAGASATYM